MNDRDGELVPAFLLRIGSAVFALILLLLSSGCDYGRMKDDESLRTYKTAIPEMPKESIPINGGIEVIRESNPEFLKNPLPYNQETIERGKIAYGFYCIHCHGPKADGNGTVGQSFTPLPTNLRDEGVQAQTDGLIFYRVSLGFKREPALAYTVPEEDRWAVIHYMRFLVSQKSG